MLQVTELHVLFEVQIFFFFFLTALEIETRAFMLRYIPSFKILFILI